MNDALASSASPSHTPAGAEPPPADIGGWSPYPGLRPFQSADSDYFFGRDAEADEVVARLRAKRFVAVIGGSGSGKSSLVLAGAIPRLRSFAIKGAGDFWAPVVATPGTNHVEGDSPIRRLARKFCSELEPSADDAGRLEACVAILRRPDGLGELVRRFGGDLRHAAEVSLSRLQVNFLFLLDQFEELFHPSNARAPIATDCAALVDRIVEQFKKPHPQVCVALTMRSEHLNDCPRYEDLPDAINGASYLVKRLGADELRQAIEQPVLRYLRKHAAERRRVRRQARHDGAGSAPAEAIPDEIPIDPALIDRLLADSQAVLQQQDHADHLPLLQHVLFWVWYEASARCTGRRLVDALTLDDLWKSVGPLPGAPVQPLAASVNTLEACLQRRCESIYCRTVGEQAAWEAVFRSLAFKEPNAGTYTQHRASMADLCQQLDIVPADNDALERHLQSWLQPHGYLHWDIESHTVKVAHETLIRRWQRLRLWVDEEDRQFHVYLRLLEDCERWKAALKGAWALSSGDILRRYEDEQLPTILKDPARMTRIDRLLGMDRDGQRLAAVSSDAARFLELSIARRAQRDAERQRAEEQKKLDQERFAQAERDNDVQREKNAALVARAEADRERNAALESSNAVLHAQTRAEAEKVRRVKISRWFLGSGLVGFLVFSLSESMLALRERTLHRGYALSAETQVKLQPVFVDFMAPLQTLRHALQGVYFYQSGTAKSTGPAATIPLRWFYAQRIEGLQSTELLGEVRSVASLRSVLRGAVWTVPAAASATTAWLTPPPPVGCAAASIGSRGDAVNFPGAQFFASPSAQDPRGLIATARDVKGLTLYVGRRNSGTGECTIETQLISMPTDALRVGITADLSNVVFEFAGYFQFYTVLWGGTSRVGVVQRVVVNKTPDARLAPGSDFVTTLPAGYRAFATDTRIGDRVLRLFDMELTPIAAAAATDAATTAEFTVTTPGSVCDDFERAQAPPPDPGPSAGQAPSPSKVFSAKVASDARTYCLRVKRSQTGPAADGSVVLASLFAFNDSAQARNVSRHLPLFLEEVVGTDPPAAVRLSAAGQWLAFKSRFGDWRALPYGVDAWRELAVGVFAQPAATGSGNAGRDEQPFMLLAHRNHVSDADLQTPVKGAGTLPCKTGSAMAASVPGAPAPDYRRTK